MGMNRDRYLFMFHNKQISKHKTETSLSLVFSLVSKHIASNIQYMAIEIL